MYRIVSYRIHCRSTCCGQTSSFRKCYVFSSSSSYVWFLPDFVKMFIGMISQSVSITSPKRGIGMVTWPHQWLAGLCNLTVAYNLLRFHFLINVFSPSDLLQLFGVCKHIVELTNTYRYVCAAWAGLQHWLCQYSSVSSPCSPATGDC